MPMTPALIKLRQGDYCKFKAGLDYIIRPCLKTTKIKNPKYRILSIQVTQIGMPGRRTELKAPSRTVLWVPAHSPASMLGLLKPLPSCCECCPLPPTSRLQMLPLSIVFEAETIQCTLKIPD